MAHYSKLNEWEVRVDRNVLMFRRFFVVDPAPRFIKIGMKPDGVLACVEPDANKTWCEHIEMALRENWDSQIMWAADTDPTGQVIKVPIVPTRGLWATVGIGPLHPTGAYTVELEVPESPLFGKPKHAKTHHFFLGFLHPGEGRAVLRSMIYDWFRANVRPENLKCKVSAHNFQKQMLLVEDLKTSANALAQNWSMWTHAACLFCMDEMANLDDLVPF